MRWMLIAVAMLGCGVAGAARAESTSPTTIQTGLLVAAEATLFADALQTLRISTHPWGIDIGGGTPRLRPGYAELNPLLGSTPSPRLVLAYFSSVMLATAGVWYAVPQSRIALPATIVALESIVVVRNGVIMHWQFGF